ncbi:MAG: flippase [Flavobacteriales bacterium]|nr:flippase [Flavobacteriales bacterium]
MNRGVFYNSALTIIRQVLSIGFGILATMIIARTLGAEGQGQYTLAILLPTLLYTFFNSGLSTSTVFYVAKKKYSDIDIYSTNLLTSFLLSIFSILVGIFVVFFYKDYFFENISQQLLLYSLLILPILFAQKNLPTIFQGKEEFKKFNFIVLLNQFGLLIFSIFFVWVLKLGVIGAILSFASAQLLMLIVTFYFLNQSYGLLWPKKYSLTYLKDSFYFGIKGHFSNVLTFLNYRLDMFLIAYFMDNSAVGLYSIAVILSERIWTVSQSVSTVLFARISNLNDDVSKNKFTSLAARNTLFISLIGGSVLALLSHWIIIILFGENFSESILPFLYLIPGVIIFSLGRVLANDFIGRGYPEINTYIAIVIAFTNLILNVWLIPLYGINGAAIATSISYTFDVIIKSIVFSKKNTVPYYDFIIMKISDFELYKNKVTIFFKKR